METNVAPQLDKYFDDGKHEALHAPRTNRIRNDKGQMTAQSRLIEAVIMENLPVAVFRIPKDVAIKAVDKVEGMMDPYLEIRYRNTPVYLHGINREDAANGTVIQGKARLVLKRVRTRESGKFVGGSAYYLHLDLLECAVVSEPKDIHENAIMLSVPKVQNVNKDAPVIDSYMIQVCASKVRAEELDLTLLYSAEELGDVYSAVPPTRPIVHGQGGGRQMKTRSILPEGWAPPVEERAEETKPVVAPAPAAKAEKPEPPPEPPKGKAGKGKKKDKAGKKDGLQKVEGDGTLSALAKLQLAS